MNWRSKTAKGAKSASQIRPASKVVSEHVAILKSIQASDEVLRIAEKVAEEMTSAHREFVAKK